MRSGMFVPLLCYKRRRVTIKTLYIIGNGFDIAHGLDTRYWKFREYLEIENPNFLMEFEALYNIHPLDDTEPWYTQSA